MADHPRPLTDPGAALPLDGFVDRVPGWIRAMLGFCSRCGSPLEPGLVPGEHRERLVCGACGFIAYVNPRLVVSTLPVTAQGELVLLRRAIEPAYGTWAQPGGFLEADETAIQGAIRETLEETGLEVAVQRFLAVIEYTLCFDAIRLPFVTYLFHLRETGGRLNANDGEAAAFSECQPAELPAIAATLRAIPGQRGYSGRWRAIAHEVASECFNHSSNAPAGSR